MEDACTHNLLRVLRFVAILPNSLLSGFYWLRGEAKFEMWSEDLRGACVDEAGLLTKPDIQQIGAGETASMLGTPDIGAAYRILRRRPLRFPGGASQEFREHCAVQANRMDMADQVVQARKVLAGPARPPGKEVRPLPTEDLRRRSQTNRSISRSSGHEWRVPRRDVTHLCDRLSLRRTR